MAFIALYWWLWLLLTAVFSGYTLFNQLKRMKGMLRGVQQGDVGKAFSSFGSGIATLVVSGLLAGVSGVLLLISIVLNIITYAS